jgi:hypothetical protein
MLLGLFLFTLALNGLDTLAVGIGGSGRVAADPVMRLACFPASENASRSAIAEPTPITVAGSGFIANDVIADDAGRVKNDNVRLAWR